MTGTRLPLWGALAGVVVGTLIAAGLVASGVLSRPTARDTSDASSDLLAAWTRSRTGTFVVQSEFRRVIAGRTLYSPAELVQRPPDRLVRQFGGVSGTVDGHPIVCATDQSNAFTCKQGDEQAAPYDEVVRQEVDDLRGLFTPPQPGARSLYRAVHGLDEGCFELYRQIPVDDAPYGTYGKLCFDPATGALTELERHLDRDVVERQHATSIATTVIDNDFDTGTDEGFGLTMDLPAPEVQGSGTTVPTPGTTVPTPGTAVPTPGTTPTDQELADLGFSDLLARSATASADDRVPYATEAVVRLLDRRASINDPAWFGADGQPIPMAASVVRVLLGRGAVPMPAG